MTGASISLLLQRVERLERELRRWRIAGVASLLVVALIVLLGATISGVPAEIRAHRLVVMDDRGKDRIVLDARDDAGVVFYDKQGTPVARLDEFDGKPSLRLAHGDASLVLTTVLDVPAVLASLGKGSAGLTILPDGSPVLELTDNQGRPRAVLGRTTLRSSQGGRIEVAEQRPVSSLVLFDDDGKLIWKTP